MSARPRVLAAGLIAALALAPESGPALPAIPGRAIELTFEPGRIRPLLERAAVLAGPLGARLVTHAPLAVAAAALLVALAAVALVLARRPAHRVRRLAARGVAPTAIARRTGLAQDHVHALLARGASGAIDRQALPSGRKLRLPRYVSSAAGTA